MVALAALAFRLLISKNLRFGPPCGKISVPGPWEEFLTFSANTRQLGDVTVVDVRGGFTNLEGEAVHEMLLDLFREGRTKVLLNFRDV